MRTCKRPGTSRAWAAGTTNEPFELMQSLIDATVLKYTQLVPEPLGQLDRVY